MVVERTIGDPPEAYGVEFLEWLRRVTEDRWAHLDESSALEINAAWQRGTRWTGGLDDHTVAIVEQRYGFRFPPDYRLFLQTLHSTTPWMRAVRYVDHDQIERHDLPGFYDWLRDEGPIREALGTVANVMEELPFDFQEWQQTWLDQDPKPALIPIFGHRYVVADDHQWVLSIVDDDAVIYSEDLRNYLIMELDLES